MTVPNSIARLFSLESILLDMPVASPRRSIELAAAVLSRCSRLPGKAIEQVFFENARLGTPWVRRGLACLSGSLGEAGRPWAAYIRFSEPLDIAAASQPIAAALFLLLPKGAVQERRQAGLELSALLTDDAMRQILLGSVSPKEILREITGWNAPRIVIPSEAEIR